MKDADLLTFSPPIDERRYLYSYIGRRLYSPNATLPAYVYDGLRTRPTLVVGTTGCGKTELLLAKAVQDSSKGRFVVFLDGKCDGQTLRKLAYYCKRVLKRPFYALLPFEGQDHLSDSWNPLVSTLSASRVAETIFSAYMPVTSSSAGDAAGFYPEYQRGVFKQIFQILRGSQRAFSFKDLYCAMTIKTVMSELARKIAKTTSGISPVFESLEKEMAKNVYADQMQRFTNFIEQLSHWTINSYNPQIQFDRLYGTDAVVYIGLPVSSEPYLMGALGNIMINELRMVAQNVQNHPSGSRRACAIYVDEARPFIDEGIADWISKVRSSGFMLHLGLQSLGSMESKRKGFLDEITSNLPNIYMFQPRSRKTAEWFSDLSCEELMASRSVQFAAEANKIAEKGVGTLGARTQNRVPADAIMSLHTGQYFYQPALVAERPFLMASPYLPDPPERPDFNYRREPVDTRAETQGLNLADRVLLQIQTYEKA